MSIKDLFGKKSNQIVSSESLKETVDRNIESVDYAERHLTEKQRFIPRVDFSDPKTFAKYGSAAKYYSDSIQAIYQTYPYDGSYAEKKDWHNKATYIDNWFFENEYPRATGYVNLNDITAGHNTIKNDVLDGRMYCKVRNPQYIVIEGGPHYTTINETGLREQIDHGQAGAQVGKEFPFKLGKANIWSPEDMRNSNLYMSGELGNTVEFWWNRHKPKQAGVICLFDLWNHEPFLAMNPASNLYGRILIEHEDSLYDSGSELFQITYLLGSDGVERHAIGNLNDLPDDFDVHSWNHYAFTCINDGEELRVRFYINGNLITDDLAGTAVGIINNASVGPKSLKAIIGAYQGPPTAGIALAQWQALTTFEEPPVCEDPENFPCPPTLPVPGFPDPLFPNRGVGAIQGCYDEFRFWKSARTSEEIGRHWFTQVAGGTNTDDANVMLGVYYKFNEGIFSEVDENQVPLTSTSYDEYVLDYSGRISNSKIWNYNTGDFLSARSLGSAINEFSYKFREFKDPIIYQAHPDVVSLIKQKEMEGFNHDTTNNAGIYHTMPEWITTEDDDEDNGGTLLQLTQIIASYFDTLHLQIQALPCLSNTRYIQDDEKPLPFANHLLESVGFIAPEIFIDSTLMEAMSHRDEDKTFEEKVYNVKNTIYQNIYNNLVGIYKSKGTEKAFRNLLHCFGIGDELIKINLYGSDVVFKFDDTYRHIAVRKNFLDYNNTDRTDSTVFQKRDPSNPNSTSYIRGSNSGELDYIPFTLEVETKFPVLLEVDHPNYWRHNFDRISICGMHEARDDEDNLGWTPTKLCDFEVYALRPELDGEERKTVQFRLAAKGFGGFDLESDFYPEVYNNEQWNFAVRIYQNKRPLTDLVLGSEFQDPPPADEDYTFEFYGVNTLLGDVQNEFLLTQTVSAADAKAALNAHKRIYVGAHYENFGPDHIEPILLTQTDIKVGSVRFWADYLDDDTIKDHARDVTNWGRKRPYKPAYLAESSLATYHVPQIETLALHWDFSTVTVADEGDPLVNSIQSDAGFWVEDVSSGSLDKTTPGGRYDWLGKVTEYQYTARGDYYFPNDREVIDRDYVYTARQHLPEIIHSSDTINILRQDDDVFTKESKAINHFWAIEKSMYQNISEEMLEMFGSIVAFDNLVGEGVNRYRMEYKDLGKLRQLFYEKVKNVPRFERYVEFYKWIDSSISAMLQELIPASANFSDELRTLIESHVLERNKYWNKYPTLEVKDKPPETPILGINEMLYNWKHGRAALEENRNCLWWNIRTERDHDLLTTGDPDIDADKNQLLHAYQTVDSGSWTDRRLATGDDTYNMKSYQGQTFVLRSLSKPYKFSADKNLPIHGGTNYPPNKKLQYVRTETPFGSDNSVCITPIVEQESGFDCLDDYESDYTVKRRLAFAAANLKYEPGTEENQAKGTLLSPFDLYADVTDDNAYTGRYWANLPSDTYGDDMEVPMQGVFTDTHVGGLQHRHIIMNRGDDDLENRPEAWIFQQGCFVGPDQISVHNPRARYYRDEKAKRPVNIRNIETTIHHPIHGNFRFLYQVVTTVSRKKNNSWFTKIEGIPAHDIWSVQSQTVRGHYDFELPDRSLHPDGNQFWKQYGRDWVEEDKSMRLDSKRYGHEHVIVERFSAPGSPHTIPRGMLDVEAEEFSAYNQLNYRNLDVRVHLKRWLTHHTRWGGYRSWYRQRPVLDCWEIKDNPDGIFLADWNPLLDPNPGSPGDVGVFCTANYHKMHRNVRYAYRPQEYFDTKEKMIFWGDAFGFDGSDDGSGDHDHDTPCDPEKVYPVGHPCCQPYSIPIVVKYVCEKKYDNWWQQHQLPRSGYQYRWIKDSVLPVECPQGYAESFTNVRAEYPTIIVDPDDFEYGLMPREDPYDDFGTANDTAPPPGVRGGPIKEDSYWRVVDIGVTYINEAGEQVVTLDESEFIPNTLANWIAGSFTLSGAESSGAVKEGGYTYEEWNNAIGATLLENVWENSNLIIEAGFPFMRVFKRWDEKYHPFSHEYIRTNTDVGFCDYKWSGVNLLGDNITKGSDWEKYNNYYSYPEPIPEPYSPRPDPHGDVINEYLGENKFQDGIWTQGQDCDSIEDQLQASYKPMLSFNELMLHRSGPYQHPMWKQIRGDQHPIIRFHRKHNILSMLDHTNAKEFVYTVKKKDKDGKVIGTTDRRLVYRERRSDNVTNYVEPCSSWNMPMRTNLGFPGSSIGGKGTHTFSNNLELFSNPFLTQRLSLVKCTRQMYDDLLEQYMVISAAGGHRQGVLAAAKPTFFGHVYKEYIFPKHRNAGLAKIRARLNYKEEPGHGVNGYDRRSGVIRNFWRDDPMDRKRTELKTINPPVHSDLHSYAYNFSVDANVDPALNCFNYPVRRSSIWALDYHKFWDDDIKIRYINKGPICNGLENFDGKFFLNRAKSVRVMRGDLAWAGFAQFRGYVYEGQNTNPDYNEGNGHYSEDWYTSECLGFYTRLDLKLVTGEECSPTVDFGAPTPAGANGIWWYDVEAPVNVIGSGEDPQEILENCGCAILERDEWKAPRPTPQYIHNPQSCMAKEEGWAWHTGELAGNAPWHDSYEEYNKDIRLIGQNYSILPEFRISSNMEYYVNDKGGDFRAENKHMLETVGTFTAIAGKTPGAPETSGETYITKQEYHSYTGNEILADVFGKNPDSGYTYDLNRATGYESFNDGLMYNTTIIDNCFHEPPTPIDAPQTNWKCRESQPVASLNIILNEDDLLRDYGLDPDDGDTIDDLSPDELKEYKDRFSFFDSAAINAPHSMQETQGEFMGVVLENMGINESGPCYQSYQQLYAINNTSYGSGIPVGGVPPMWEVNAVTLDPITGLPVSDSCVEDIEQTYPAGDELDAALEDALMEATGESCFTLSFWVKVDQKEKARLLEGGESVGAWSLSYVPPSDSLKDILTVLRDDMHKLVAENPQISDEAKEALLNQTAYEIQNIDNQQFVLENGSLVDIETNTTSNTDTPPSQLDFPNPNLTVQTDPPNSLRLRSTGSKHLSFYLADKYDHPALSTNTIWSERPMLVDNCGNKLHFNYLFDDEEWHHVVMFYKGGSTVKEHPSLSGVDVHGDPVHQNFHKALLWVDGEHISSRYAYPDLITNNGVDQPFTSNAAYNMRRNGTLFHGVTSVNNGVPTGENGNGPQLNHEYGRLGIFDSFVFGSTVEFVNPAESQRHVLRGRSEIGGPFKSDAVEPVSFLPGKINDVSLYTGGFIDLEPTDIQDLVEAEVAAEGVNCGFNPAACFAQPPTQPLCFIPDDVEHLNIVEECVRKEKFKRILDPTSTYSVSDPNRQVGSIFVLHLMSEQCEDLNEVHAEWTSAFGCEQTVEFVPTPFLFNDIFIANTHWTTSDFQANIQGLLALKGRRAPNRINYFLQKPIFQPYENCAELTGWWKMGIPIWEREVCESSVWKEDFFKCYAHTDTVNHLSKVIDDHKELKNTYPRLTLKVNAIKKMLPYNGFYPSQRTVQLSSVFYDSISPYVTGNNDEQSYERSRTLQAMTQPFFAPGILYNTIKSGIAVDWACYAGEHTDSKNDMRDKFLERYYEVLWCCDDTDLSNGNGCEGYNPCDDVANSKVLGRRARRDPSNNTSRSEIMVNRAANLVMKRSQKMQSVNNVEQQDRERVVEMAREELARHVVDEYGSAQMKNDESMWKGEHILRAYNLLISGDISKREFIARTNNEILGNTDNVLNPISNVPYKREGDDVNIQLTLVEQPCEGAYLGKPPNFRIPFEGLVSIDSVLPIKNSPELSKIFFLAPSYYAERFESNIDPNLFILPSDAPPGAVVNSTQVQDPNLRYPYFEWTGKKNPLYEMAMHNFLAEVPNFFLKRKGFTTFASKPEKDFKNVTQGTKYYMDVHLYVTEDFAMTISPYDGETCFVTDDFGDEVTDATGRRYTTQGRYFGPAVKCRTDVEDKFYIGDPAQAPYVPPYFYGRAKAQIVFEPIADGRPTLDEIFQNSRIEYINEEMEELFAAKMVPPPLNVSADMKKIFDVSYRSTPAYQGRMPIEASINFFGKTKQRKITYDVVHSAYELPVPSDVTKEVFLPRLAEDSESSETEVWTISPRYECPTLNFKSVDNLRKRQYKAGSDIDVGLFTVLGKNGREIAKVGMDNYQQAAFAKTGAVASTQGGFFHKTSDGNNANDFALIMNRSTQLYLCGQSACAPHTDWECVVETPDGRTFDPSPCGTECSDEKLPHDTRGVGMWSGYGSIPTKEEGIFITLEESHKRNQKYMGDHQICEITSIDREVPTAKLVINSLETWHLHDTTITLKDPYGEETTISIGQPTNVQTITAFPIHPPNSLVINYGDGNGGQAAYVPSGNQIGPGYVNWYYGNIYLGPPRVVTFNTAFGASFPTVDGGTMATGGGNGPNYRGEYDVEAFLGAESWLLNPTSYWSWSTILPGGLPMQSSGLVMPENITRAIAHYINGRHATEADFDWTAVANPPGSGTIMGIGALDVGTVEIKWNERNPAQTGTKHDATVKMERGLSTASGIFPDNKLAVYFVNEHNKVVWDRNGNLEHVLYGEETEDEIERCYDVAGSLVDICGFQPSTERIGELADEKEISEAIVMIPFVDVPIDSDAVASTTNVMGRNFFKISKGLFNYTRRNIEAGKPAIIAGGEYNVAKDIPETSVSQMIQRMKKYNLPPQLDFLTYPLKSGEDPFVMYIFEFHHTLDKQDLADIWQGLMPKIGHKAEKDADIISHEMNPTELFEAKKLPGDVRWLTFKIKRKANINYYSVTADSKDDDRFRFDFQFGEKPPEYSYNWPYDFFSLVELAQIEGGVSTYPAYEDVLKTVQGRDEAGIKISRDTEETLQQAHAKGSESVETEPGSLANWQYMAATSTDGDDN